MVTSYTILIPGALTPENVLGFSLQIHNIPLFDEYTFDLSEVSHVEPFGMLYLSAILRQFMSYRSSDPSRRPNFKAINYQNNSYASFMGFYKSFGLNYGNEPGAAPGSTTYIPLTRLKVKKIESQAFEELVHVGEVIEAEASRISKILTQNKCADLLDTLTYSLREIFRNVVEHSTADHIWYAAQYWPSKHLVELAILDEGIGLYKSLIRNRKLNVTCDESAIYLAIQPGVSGVTEEMKKRLPHDWRNSGYGLFMTCSLAKKGGDFMICSNSKGIHINSHTSELIDSNFNGTAIRMVIDTSMLTSLDSALNEIRKIGEKLARESKSETNLTASMVSRMLTKNHSIQ